MGLLCGVGAAGPERMKQPWVNNPEMLQLWKDGNTGTINKMQPVVHIMHYIVNPSDLQLSTFNRDDINLFVDIIC